MRNILQESGEPWRPELMAYEQASDMGVHDLWLLQKERTTLQADYLRHVVDAGVDATPRPDDAVRGP